MAGLGEDMRKFIRDTLKEEAESKRPAEACPLTSLLSNKQLREGLNEFRASMGLETPVEMTPAFQDIQAAFSEVKAPSAAGSEGEDSSSYESSSEEESEEEVKKKPVEKKGPKVEEKKAVVPGRVGDPAQKKKRYGRNQLDTEEPLTEEQAEKERHRRINHARAIIDFSPEAQRLGPKLAVGVRRDIFWPMLDSLSRFHVEEQKSIVECLLAFPNGRRPATFRSKQEEYLWANFDMLILGERMAQELQQARAELEQAARKDERNYKFLPIAARSFANSRIYRRRLRLRRYPPVYKKMGTLSWEPDQPAEPGTSSRIFSFEELIAEMGFWPDIKVPVVQESTCLRMNNEKQMEKLFPAADDVHDNPMFASNQPVSRDKNVQVIVPRYKPDVVMSSSAFKALLTIGRSTKFADIPVVVVEKQGLKVVFVDKPMPSKRVTALDRKAKWFKFGVKELLCHYPLAKEEPKKGHQGKQPGSQSKTEKNRKKKQTRKAKAGGQQHDQSMESSQAEGGEEEDDEVKAALEFHEYEPAVRPSLEQKAHPPLSAGECPQFAPFGVASGGEGSSTPSKPQGQGHAAQHSAKQSPQAVAQSSPGASQAASAPEVPKVASVFDQILNAQAKLFPEPAWKKAVGFRASQEADGVGPGGLGDLATDHNTVFRTSPALASVKDRMHKPPGMYRNVAYRLWSLGQNDNGEALRVIIRTADDGQKMDERTNRSTRCVLASRMEFQYLYGYEFPSWLEAASNWADLCLRPGANLIRVHHSQRFGLVYSIEEKDLGQVTLEGLNSNVEFDPASALKKLEELVRQLVALDVGTYMLKPEPPANVVNMSGRPVNMDNTVYICREHQVAFVDQNDPSLYLFRQENEAVKPHQDSDFIHYPWRPTNPRVLTPLAVKYSKAPGVLWPTRVGFSKEGFSKYGKARKERRKEIRRQKRAKLENRQDEGVQGRVVDASKGFR